MKSKEDFMKLRRILLGVFLVALFALPIKAFARYKVMWASIGFGYLGTSLIDFAGTEIDTEVYDLVITGAREVHRGRFIICSGFNLNYVMSGQDYVGIGTTLFLDGGFAILGKREPHRGLELIPFGGVFAEFDISMDPIAVYAAYGRVQETIKQTGSLETPLHIRNAPTKLMKSMGYGKGYQYAHDYQDAIVFQEYLPDRIRERKFYMPADRGYERIIKKRLDQWQARKTRMQASAKLSDKQ